MSRTVTVLRALLALLWAGALVLALGDRVPTTGSDVPVAAAALLAGYPLIDVAASLLGAAREQAVMRVNALVGVLAAVAVGATAFGADAGAAMAAFGAWAVVSGAIQLGVALHRDRAGRPQRAMVLSGGLLTVAGLGFLSGAGMDAGHLAGIAGYMAVGAVLYLVAARGAVATAA